MDFSNRGNRPGQQQQQVAPQKDMGGAPVQSTAQSFEPAKTKNSKMDLGKLSSVFVLFTVSILVLVLIIGLIFGFNSDDSDTSQVSETAVIQTDKYQAIFLNSQDGQVYFGKLSIYSDNLYKLTDIYYVRVENPIQPEGSNQPQQANISLAKLGNELHGPQDEMFIARDKLLYWENLKDDGQVVTAITDYKANGEADPQQQTPAADTTQQNDTPAQETPTTIPNTTTP